MALFKKDNKKEDKKTMLQNMGVTRTVVRPREE